MTDPVRRWMDSSPFARALGAVVEELEEERAVIDLPFAEDNSNGDKALHGGVAASMIGLSSQCLARTVLGEDTGPWHLASVQVGYLAAALGESIRAEARLLRRGKELAYADVEVTSESGRSVAHGLVTVRGRQGAEAPELPASAGDPTLDDPGPMGPFMGRVPYHAKLGISAVHMAAGLSRLVMPWKDTNADASGGVHEGAILGLIDTTGAMAAWAETGPGRFKASTPGIQARILATPEATEGADLVGYGRVRLHDRETLFSEVEVARVDDGRLVAQGTVNYRIVTPDLAG